MQTRNPGLRALTLALAGVLTLGLAACEETKTVVPQTPTTLTISPSGTIDLEVGDVVTVVANAVNADNAAVTWASSNSAIASVSGTGSVTAVSPGIATITATVAGRQGAVSQALAVRVTGGDVEIPVDSAQVLIEGLVDGDNNPIDTDDVEGQIFVRMDVTRGSADSLRVMIGDDVVCRQTFTLSTSRLDGSQGSASLAQAEFVCPINTLATDTATDGPRFENGATTVTAQLLDDGVVIATATRAITLDNEDAVTASVTADTTAIGDSGLRWHGGDVTVDVSPVIFAGGTTIDRVIVTPVELDEDGDVIGEGDPATDDEAPFSVTFDADDNFEDTTAERLTFRVTTVTAAGDEGPEGTSSAIRYDNEAPAVVAADVDDIEWINEREFSEFVDADVEDTDMGVGGVMVRFFALEEGEADDSDDIFDNGEEVQTGADLEETNTSTGYDLAIAACDALGNCDEVDTDQFGVDLGDPTIDDFELVGDSINPTDLTISIEDEISGPADQPYFVTAIGTNADSTGFCAIGDEDEDCAETDETEVDFSVLDDEDAYYTVTVRAVDQAGNFSEEETVTFLLDATAPVVEDLDFSVSIEPGDEAEFEATASDNVDLETVEVGFAFGAAAPFTEIIAFRDVVGEFGLPLTTEEDVSITTTYIGSLYTESTNTWNTTTTIFVRGTDVAGLSADDFELVTPDADEDLPAGFESFAITEVDGEDTEGEEFEGSVSIRAELDINDIEATATFERVNFFLYNDATGEVTFIGSDETASQTTSASDRIFAYTATLDTTEFEDGVTYSVFAVGIEGDGDAIATEEFDVEIVNED